MKKEDNDIFAEDEKEAIEEAIEESQNIMEKSDHFEIEVYLSSDGKNTVKYRVPAEHSTQTVRRKALETAKKIYDAILEVYGTKQAQAVREYSNGKEKKQEYGGEMNQDCKHEQFKVLQSKSEKNPGRWFKNCVTCKQFLGWVDVK